MVDQDARYTIEELAQEAGLNRRTVRYYIQLGLVDRPVGETRAAYYTRRHLEQLLRVVSLSAEGLTLEAIGRLLKSEPGTGPVAAGAAIGQVAVRSHLTLAPGVELVVEPGRAGLTPEQLKALFRAVLERYEAIQNAAVREDEAENGHAGQTGEQG